MSSFCLVALGGSCSQCSASALLRLSPANWPSVLATPLSPFGPLSPLSQNPNNVRLLCVLFCVYAFTVQVSVCPAEFPAILAQQENSGPEGKFSQGSLHLTFIENAVTRNKCSDLLQFL